MTQPLRSPFEPMQSHDTGDVGASWVAALRLSVIIPNYNYAQFLAQAIDSALAIDWPQVQVIVVDDGSTDGSREVMARYEGRITRVFQANGGQYQAYNTGYRLACGNVLVFLDSDDLLDAGVMRAAAAVWCTGISKVQFRLRTIDAAGQPLGSSIPQFGAVAAPRQIRQWASATSTYPTPPGSGNVYARAYLERIFPLDDACGRPGDSSCLAAAPFLGDVVTLDRTLGSYRMHAHNDGAAAGLDAAQFHLHVVRAQQRLRYVQRIARGIGIDVADDALDRSLHYLPYRLASLRLARPTHPLAGDSAGKVVLALWRALRQPQGVSAQGKLALAAWTVLVLMLPHAAGNRLILWRFVPAARPPMLRSTLLRLRVMR